MNFSTSSASGQEEVNPVRCYLVSNLFARSGPDERQKKAGQDAGLYYLAQLGGSDAQIEVALTAQAKSINAKNAAASMQASARAVSQKLSRVPAIGQKLQTKMK